MCTNERKKTSKKFRWNRFCWTIIVMALLLNYQRIMFALLDGAKSTEEAKKKTAITVAATVEETTEKATKEREKNETSKGNSSIVQVIATEASIEEETSEPNSTSSENVSEGVYSIRLNRYMTDYEMYLLTMITCSEAGFESYDGKVAVAATILNRMESQIFPDGVYDVIFQYGQFSSALNGKFYYSCTTELKYEDIADSMLIEAKYAVYAALAGEDPTNQITGGALFFYNPDYCSDEELAMRNTLSCTQRIGNHIFYRDWT